MANLNLNTQYNTSNKQSPLAGLSNISKLLQQNTQKTTSFTPTWVLILAETLY